MTGSHRDRFVALHAATADLRRRGAARHGRAFADLGRSEPLDAHLDAHPAPATAWAASRRYLPNGGAAEVRERVARTLGRQMGLPLQGKHIAIAAGGTAALTAALAALAQRGDEVVLPVPHYPPSPSQIELSGAEPVLVACDANGRLMPDELASAVGPRTAALLLTSPSNPTGTVYAARDLAALDAVLPRRAGWIVDEAYADVAGATHTPACAAAVLWTSARDWLVMRTASKSIGRPGLRVAILVGPPATVARAEAVLAFVCGAAGSFGQTAVAAGLAAAARAGDGNGYADRLSVALDALGDGPLEADPPEGGYFLWVRGPESGAPLGTLASLERLCTDHGAFVSPGALYGDPRGVRVSLSSTPEALHAGVRRLVAHAASRERTGAETP